MRYRLTSGLALAAAVVGAVAGCGGSSSHPVATTATGGAATTTQTALASATDVLLAPPDLGRGWASTPAPDPPLCYQNALEQSTQSKNARASFTQDGSQLGLDEAVTVPPDAIRSYQAAISGMHTCTSNSGTTMSAEGHQITFTIHAMASQTYGDASTAYQEIDTLVGAGLPNLVMDIVITRVGAANLAVGMSNFGSVDAGQFQKVTDLAVAKARAAFATK